jgi:hypothetical protein
MFVKIGSTVGDKRFFLLENAKAQGFYLHSALRRKKIKDFQQA